MFLDGFDDFWLDQWHGERKAKKDAQKAWSQIRPSPAMRERIKEACAWQAEERHTKQIRKQWVPELPLPATWIRGERWTDEPPAGFRMKLATIEDPGAELQRIKDEAAESHRRRWEREREAERFKEARRAGGHEI